MSSYSSESGSLPFQLDLVSAVRLAFVGTAAAVLFVYLVPALRSRFLDYGPRASQVPQKKDDDNNKANVESKPPSPTALDKVAAVTVPHSWFTSFYATSAFCSLFWASDLLLHGPVSSNLSAYISPTRPSMTFLQVLLTWTLVLVQGTRRLYECYTLARPSTSRMWFGHWLLGVGFYVGLSIAVWVEGVPAFQNYDFSFEHLYYPAPSLRTLLTSPFFLLASDIQYECHSYLASLKTAKPPTQQPGKVESPLASASLYKIPSHPAFNLTLTPHYFAECIIYLSLAFLAAPQGHWINGTLACAFVFVAVNLGVTAEGTWRWYQDRFGDEAVKGRWRMIPFVF